MEEKKVNMDNKELDIEKPFEQEYEDVSFEDAMMLKYFLEREKQMDGPYNKEFAKWQIWDDNVDSPVYDGEDGKAIINMAIEQSLIEMRRGLVPELLPIKVSSEGPANINQLETAKYVLDSFVEKEDIIEEIVKFDHWKAHYGTGILYSGVRMEPKIINEAEGEGEFYNTDYEGEKKIIRHIGIQNVDIRKFKKDEKGTTIKNCMDCIREEGVSVEEFRMRYLTKEKKNIKGFHYVASVGVNKSENESYRDNDVLDTRNVKLQHYYNKLNGRYCMIANGTWPIYVGRNPSKHGELPFSACQEYGKLNSFYGIGIPEKVKSTKPYINNFFKAALDRVWKGDAIIKVGVVTDGELWDDPSETAEWNFTGKGTVTPFSPNRDITPNIAMIQQMETWNIKGTGISVDPNFILQAKTAFQTGVFKEEQNARLKPNGDERNICLDRAFTLLLSDISQFAPNLYAEVTLNKDTNEIEDYNWLKIKVKDKEVIKKTKKSKKSEKEDDYDEKEETTIEFKDKPGTDDFFELNDKLLKGSGMMKVRIETPTTTTNLKSLEKAEWNELITTVVNLASVYPAVLEKFPLEELISRMELIYGFDAQNLTARTTEKMNRKKIGDIKMAIGALGTGNPIGADLLPNTGEDVQTTTGVPPTETGTPGTETGATSPQSYGGL